MKPMDIVEFAGNGDFGRVCEVAKKFPTKVDITYKGQTALQAATKCGHIDIIKSLLQHGSDKNKQNGDGDTCLHIAVKFRQPEAIRMLCRMGANQNISNNAGHTPKELAKENDYVDCIEGFSSTPIKKKIQMIEEGIGKGDFDASLNCDTCAEEIALVQIMPCGEERLCLECSLKYDNCGICQKKIDQRLIGIDEYSIAFVTDLKQKKEAMDKLTCRICYQETITGAFIPCGHTFCDCAKNFKLCPICKGKVERFFKLFL